MPRRILRLLCLLLAMPYLPTPGAAQDRPAASLLSVSLGALAFATEATVGYIIGAYAIEPGNPDIGKFTLVLHRAPGGPWQIVSDMDNPNP
ncbi:MAG: hypothetical protein SGI84_13630 [Gemmatimonadota bacterium]|nr:hypothetical protein [Gemmatimonadota bacterium]